jgi:hypothetical protein
MVQVLKRITKHRMGKHPCQTAVIHLNPAAACNVVELEIPAVAALFNTLDLERKQEPDLVHEEPLHVFEEQEGNVRDSNDDDGVQLLGNGRSADAQEVSSNAFQGHCARQCILTSER